MGTLKLIGAIALGIFLCFFVLSTINAQRAEYAKRLGTFEGVPYSDLTSRAGNYQLIAYASLIVAIGSLAGACAFPGGKTCPRCREIVKKKAVACRFCEYSFEERPTRTESPDPSFTWCSVCGKEFFAKLSKCPFCGSGHGLFRKKGSKV
jgi:ATP dependent DNA ligase domain